MKATKVLGIVLGVLLVAGLFAGAAAATATEEKNLGDVYAYVLYTSQGAGCKFAEIDLSTNATWTDANGNEVTFVKEPTKDNDYYIDGKDLVEGVYTRGINNTTFKITVKQPTATVTARIFESKNEDSKAIADLIGGTADVEKFVKFEVPGNFASGLMFTAPGEELGDKTFADKKFATLDGTGFTEKFTLSGVDLGIWKVQAVFKAGTGDVGDKFSTLAPSEMYGKEYYFTIIKNDTTKKLTAEKDSVTQGNKVVVTLTAPYGDWAVFAEKGDISTTQNGVYSKNEKPVIPAPKDTDAKAGYVTVHVGTDGIASFAVKATSTSDIKVKLYDNDNSVQDADKGKLLKTLTIKVNAASVTGKAVDDAAAVNIGNEIDLEGTNEVGGKLYLFIKGTNFEFQPIYTKILEAPVTEDDLGFIQTTNGKEWTYTLDTGILRNNIATLVKDDNGVKRAVYNGKRPDAGTYTIYAASLTGDGEQLLVLNGANPGEEEDEDEATTIRLILDDLDDDALCSAYATISVAFKQPFITITKAPEVVAQGSKLEVIGTAEGTPAEVQYYIFGTNFFASDKVGVTDGEFTVSVAKTVTSDMAAGQYFLVIQHPMYDKVFNIAPVGKDIVLNKNGAAGSHKDDVTGETVLDGTVIFNTDVRQSANAAQALCDALDTQDIDDMYVKASFIIAGKTSYIDPIPSQITKGQVLTVSGTTTGHKNDVVTVELRSTAFAAIPKEAVGSASFIALTTKIDETGVWSITFDTSNLNADEYTCSVAVGQLDAETAKISIVEGTNPQPTQTTPVTPTETIPVNPTQTPATPGFGALAALAGLGAVAVLLLRRQ